MTVATRISGPDNVNVAVTKDQELSTITSPYPPFSTQKIQPFRQYLTNSSDSNEMAVNGSITNVDFYVEADRDNDRYITSLNWIVGYGTSGSPYQWADGTALTNGSRLFYQNYMGEVDIHEGIKTNQDLFRLSFDRVVTAWQVRGVNAANDYGYFITTDLTRLGFVFGIKLDAGTTQRLTCRIRDNAGTSADTFNCIAYGFDRFQ